MYDVVFNAFIVIRMLILVDMMTETNVWLPEIVSTVISSANKMSLRTLN